MRFKQARELLAFVAEARLALANRYQSWLPDLKNPRSQLLLQFLASKEREQQQALVEYMELAPAAALDTWFENTGETDLLERLQAYQLAEDIDEHQLLKLVLKFDNELMALLSQQVPNAVSTETEELLLNLIGHEQERQRRMVHGVARMDDM
ncbi:MULTISPECIES: hypothetical protein [Corallincola]|uniref:Uncharacterized protein n=3 Tax=Corallincola TaxID=1775176 RepID=A0A368NPA5_9GAMM|nr:MULTISPECIES: hypothetical protein [Corallincola]RCU51494.1 hypothetical protein DU002_03205 [Corallincola holothuriorum]TAA46995.1 hypothetical protein EXY25_07035 [Corallincola spongiicola]TCI04651.1 hypothetical protein EZV61_01360 [Corallincola luteus]